RVVERMAQVERPGDVGRRDDDGVGRLGAGRVGMEVPLLEPKRVPAVLGVLGVILLGEFGGAHAWSGIEDRIATESIAEECSQSKVRTNPAVYLTRKRVRERRRATRVKAKMDRMTPWRFFTRKNDRPASTNSAALVANTNGKRALSPKSARKTSCHPLLNPNS